jgi:hypothetical protein
MPLRRGRGSNGAIAAHSVAARQLTAMELRFLISPATEPSVVTVFAEDPSTFSQIRKHENEERRLALTGWARANS